MVDNCTVDDGVQCFGENLHRISGKNRNIGVFAGFKCPDAVFGAADFGGTGGDSAQAFQQWEACFYGKTGAEWEILDERYRVVGGKRNRDTGLLQNTCGFKIKVPDF